MALQLPELPSLAQLGGGQSLGPYQVGVTAQGGAAQKLEPFYQMSLQAALQQAGDKPIIPQLQVNDVNKYNQQAIGKTTEINRTNFEQLGQMVRQANPYFDQQNAQIAKNTMADLQGVLPQDVVDRYRNLAASRTVGSGQSQRENLTLRDLGLNSLQRMDIGRQASQQQGDYLKRQLVPELARVEEFMFSPALELQQNQQLFNRDLLAAQVAAAPDPQQAALGQVMETYAGLLAGNALAKPVGTPIMSSGGGSSYSSTRFGPASGMSSGGSGTVKAGGEGGR